MTPVLCQEALVLNQDAIFTTRLLSDVTSGSLFAQHTRGWQRFIAPAVVLGFLGIVSVRSPEILGNGEDLSQLLFADQVGTRLLLTLLLLKPLATILCMRSGVPGSLFTPSLTFGALLGAALGHAWSAFWPGVPAGLFALLGAGAVLSATTHGPISAIVLVMELTGRDRSFVLPLI